MKTIAKDELFQHLGGFLKARGIHLTEGSYARGIQKSCELLTDAISLVQQGLDKAKTQLDKKLEQVRQTIHARTAPKAPPRQTASAGASAKAKKSKAGSGKAKGSRSKKK